jgi:hypothetical protein
MAGITRASSALGDLSLLALLLCGPIGAAMTILAAIRWRQEKLVSFWKTYPRTLTGPVPGRILPVATKTIATYHRPKSATPRPFARLSQTSLVLVLTLFTIWTAVVVSASLERVFIES